MDVGARMLGGKLADPELSVRERDFLATLAPAFTDLEDSAGDNLFVDGAARLFSEQRFQDLPQLSEPMDVLERRLPSSGCCARPWPSPACTCASAARTPRPSCAR